MPLPDRLFQQSPPSCRRNTAARRYFRLEATRRPGFERLLRTLCDGQVGAVFSIEASRLARNGRDWHTLLEFCSIVGALLIDAEAVYDPRLTNDRLLLG